MKLFELGKDLPRITGISWSKEATDVKASLELQPKPQEDEIWPSSAIEIYI